MPGQPPTDSGGTPLPDTPSVRALRVLKLLLTVLLLAVTLYQAVTGSPLSFFEERIPSFRAGVNPTTPTPTTVDSKAGYSTLTHSIK